MNVVVKNYDNDPRPACKYGSLCYQKNEVHHEKYKHPSNKPAQNQGKAKHENKNVQSGTLKQQKLNFFTSKKESEPKKNDIESTVNEDTSSFVDEIDVEECKKIIKSLFLVDMPDDFFSFWYFCKSIKPVNPIDALSDVGLTLVGPFDVLDGTLREDIVSNDEALRHWRYYYDPPEFQTLIKGDGADLFHLGYFRDDPNELPVFVAYNEAAKNGFITHVAENLFGALDWFLNKTEKTGNPFKKMKTSNIKASLHEWAKNNKFPLEKNTKNMQERNKAAVCKTFHQAGIVVPYDEKTELGYRPLSETPNELKKILKKIETVTTSEERASNFDRLYSVVNWANIAMDEGDFGTNLELGLNLFSYGTNYFDSIIIIALENAYSLLRRKPFIKIIKVHLQDRKKGSDLSILKNKKNK